MAEIIPPLLRKRAGMMALAVLVLIVTAFTVLVRPADAAKSLVTVYADDSERVISTTVLTVGEALDRAGVQLEENDLVEPGLDTFINEAIFRINVYRARPVTVVDGYSQKTVMTPYQSPKLIAQDAGYTVYDEDQYTFELIDDILSTGAIGQRLIINRATPVNISLYGDTFTYRSHLKTVGEIIAEAGITISEDDTLNQPLNTPITKDMNIFISRMGTDVVVEEAVVPFEVDTILDSNMFAGQNSIQTPGADGIDIVTYQVELRDGVEISRSEVQRVRKTEPVTQVMVVGTKIADPSSNAAIGQAMAAGRGWVGEQWQCLYSLWMKESNWNHLASNPYSGAYGIPQALPGTKMETAGGDWLTNPATQIAWGLTYIEVRYGTPCDAWAHSQSVGWY